MDRSVKLPGFVIIVEAFTSNKFASALLEEMTLGPQQAIVTVTTVVAPYAEFTFKGVNGIRAVSTRKILYLY
jgi:hypothetical protein